MIEVTNVVRAYPDPGEGSSGITSIFVKNHWNDDSKVVIIVEGCIINLYAKDLRAAIDNALNSAR